MIAVVVIDDQSLVRQGLRSLLDMSGEITVVGEAADGEEGLRVVRAARPDVVLLDVVMPKMGGLDALRALQAEGGAPPTILLTTFDDDEALFAGLKAGARGYLLKDVSLEQLIDAVRRVAAGETLIRPAITERVVKRAAAIRSGFEALDPPDRLTPRELQILRLMAGGFSNREIAEALGTAEGTVKAQASSILSKLGVRDRTRAVLRALDRGYL